MPVLMDERGRTDMLPSSNRGARRCTVWSSVWGCSRADGVLVIWWVEVGTVVVVVVVERAGGSGAAWCGGGGRLDVQV
jgi:hypothetical protein